MLQNLNNKKKSFDNNVIPVFKPLIQDRDISAASRSLKEGWLGMGKDVQNFELAIKKICKLKKKKCSSCKYWTCCFTLIFNDIGN